MCLCASHTNVKFAFEDAVTNCKRCNLPVPTFEHYVDLVDALLCPTESRSRACLQEECDECGPEKLDEITRQWVSAPEDTTFKYRSVEKDANGRLGMQAKESSPHEFAEFFKGKLRGFALHRFLAVNQKDELDKHLVSLDLESLVIISDFAEKYSAKEFEEVQSLHWHSALVTIFTSVAMFHAYDPITGNHKKAKVYFGFFSERPQQDHHMASFCHRRIVQWIKETFGQTFQAMTLCSDRCAGQFCSRKVFGSLAESRRNLCVEHQNPEPLCPCCPRVSLHFSCAGHGKNEVDHVGALFKTNFRKEELNKRPLRDIADIGTHLQNLNFHDLQRTREGRQDNKGFFFSGIHGEVVNPGDVSEPQTDWERIEGTRDLHQLHTTPLSGELLIREASCFSCPECETGNFVACCRVEKLGPVLKVTMHRTPSAAVATNRTKTKTRAGRDRQRHEIADLACPGSVIAIARGQRQELAFILVTKSRGQSADPDLLQGKILLSVNGSKNSFTSTGAKLLSFEGGLVRSPPLIYESKSANINGKKLTVMKIDDAEFQSLVAEYLF